MKVLIITYYWPPAGGSGVQRWLKFAKYLPHFGVEPILYVPQNPNYPTTDVNLLKEAEGIKLIKRKIFNPQDLLPNKKTSSGVANINKGGLLSWIRGNFFIPDAKIFWIRPSVKYLTKYIRENKIDLIISSGPPHSMHLIADKLKRKTGVKWIADFRDPWTSLYYTQEFRLSNFAKNRNKRLEQQVLKNADTVITVSQSIKEELGVPYKTALITNGYDDEVTQFNSELDSKFSISHIGLLPKQSNPNVLWEVLMELVNENIAFKTDLQISLTGNVCDEVISSIQEYHLEDYLLKRSYVAHEKAIQLQKESQLLLLLIPNIKNSKGILTGKVFEYMTSKRPILAIGDEEGDLAKILSDTDTGKVVGFNNKNKLKSLILEHYNNYLIKELFVEAKGIKKYHRKNLTGVLANEIKKLIK